MAVSAFLLSMTEQQQLQPFEGAGMPTRVRWRAHGNLYDKYGNSMGALLHPYCLPVSLL